MGTDDSYANAIEMTLSESYGIVILSGKLFPPLSQLAYRTSRRSTRENPTHLASKPLPSSHRIQSLQARDNADFREDSHGEDHHPGSGGLGHDVSH